VIRTTKRSAGGLAIENTRGQAQHTNRQSQSRQVATRLLGEHHSWCLTLRRMRDVARYNFYPVLMSNSLA
jgi:hypothetical protein